MECLYVKRENDGRGLIHYRIKEILRHDDRLDATLSKHIREAKEKDIQLVKKVINLLINSTSFQK